MDIYPRADWSRPTVERYVEALTAGDRFPPIILESGTDRLLDGMHRYQAHKRLGLTEIAAEYHEIPAGMPGKLYAAGLSARNGDRITGKELQDVVLEVVAANPDYSMQAIARCIGVTRQTVGKWASPIVDRRKGVRKIRALLLSRLGWPQERIADFLGVKNRQTISTDLQEMSEVTFLAEEILREALDGLPPECAEVAEQIREERIFASWSDDERDLLKHLRDGETTVLNMRADAHPNLHRWADDAGLFVRIDRRTDWGNPFEMPNDGDRETVIMNYAEHYLPHKPSLLSRLDELHGKALGCWCAPEPCHGDILKARAEG
jgi:DNA-binding MarR family transcriptional regulator